MPRFPDLSEVAGHLSDRVFGGTRDDVGADAPPRFALNVGDTHLSPPPFARAEAQREADHAGLHRYSPPQGDAALLDAVLSRLRTRHGLSREAAEVQVQSGATAGLSVVCAALLQPGDEVLLPSPYWPLIRGIIRSRGAIPVEVPLWTRLSEPGFDPAEALRAAITPRTVALYLNTPHNPTGGALDLAALEGIAALAAAHDLWVVSDEVYEELYFDATPPPSPLQVPAFAERTIHTHSLSKAYALAGARIGYSHGPAAAMAAVRGVQTFVTYCAPRPMQRAGARALLEGDAWLQDVRQRYAHAGRFAAAALGIAAPAGGTFLFFDLRPHLVDGDRPGDLLRRLARAGVVLTPGSACGVDYADWARLCFTVVPPTELEQALRTLCDTLGRPDPGYIS